MPRTFDELSISDLESVYGQGKEEVLRGHAFRILLSRHDSVEKLERLAFQGERGPAGWTTKELIEITNHFRLLSSPENEIRLFRECGDSDFRGTPRVREFYVLALNRDGKPAEAIREASRIVAEGRGNALVWGMLGESYSARMLFAEKLARALADVERRVADLDRRLIARLPGFFPEINPADLTIPLVRSLREKNLGLATRIFRRGFRESGSSFAGLGWMQRTIDRLTDLASECEALQHMKSAAGPDGEASLRRTLAADQQRAAEKELAHQLLLVGVALELQGGRESLDYWTHAGMLLHGVIGGADPASLRVVLGPLLAAADASFKLGTTIAELMRLRDSFSALRAAASACEGAFLPPDPRIDAAAFAIAELRAGQERFIKTGGRRGDAINVEYRRILESEPADDLDAFLGKTINFRALTGNLVPLYISGGIGAVGARVPDLLINRQALEDLADIVETAVLQPLTPEERGDPRAVIARIQQIVGNEFRVGTLQDLESREHRAFEARSDGLIALSGIDENMRRYTRTATEMTATLLMRNGDCRETMYLGGALFACWQQIRGKRLIAEAMLCLELDFAEGFENIVHGEIPALLRYQLRGGQFLVYADSIAMRAKYRCERRSADDPTAVACPCGIEDLKAGRPLTSYEIENARFLVRYADGSSRLLGPGFPAEFRAPASEPGTPAGAHLIPNANPDYENVRSGSLLNPVEEHALTVLYDSREKSVAFCDGFYNEALFDSPYRFGSGPVAIERIRPDAGLIRAGSRAMIHPDGSLRDRPVYLEFLPFSRTEYDYALSEGDIPGTIQLMGRTFRGDLKRERRRLEEGSSPIPVFLERVQRWQQQRTRSAVPERRETERALAGLVLDLARNQPDLVRMKEVSAQQPLITEGAENSDVFLILSGELRVFRNGRPLREIGGSPVVVGAGEIVGELSALTVGKATATVAGNATVLCIAMSVIRQRLDEDPAFRGVMEKLAAYRIS